MRADAVLKQAIEKIGCCGVFRDFRQGTFCSDVLKTFGTIYGHFSRSEQSLEPTPIPVLVIHFSPPQNDLIRRAPSASASPQPRSYREWPRVDSAAVTA